MFEHITFEDILQRMLDRIPDSIDKREGSVVYDALAPAAIEMQNMYISLDNVLFESFANTASLPYLRLKAEERGLYQHQASSAVLKAITTPTDVDVPIGSRFSINDLNYAVVEKIEDGVYKLECETAGIAGNSYSGDILPIDYVQGLESISISEIIVPGEDAESEDSLRERYFESISSQSFGGNIADYRRKVLEMEGVGGVKVTPTHEGGGTVLLTFIDGSYGVPSSELVSIVQNEIDPVENQGKGYGVAPIGHRVTVEGAEAVPINIVTEIKYANNWSWESSKTYIQEAVNRYFLGLREGWDETNDTSLAVRISHIESAILQCEGVVDVYNTSLNGSESNLYLTKYQIPVGGTINGN